MSQWTFLGRQIQSEVPSQFLFGFSRSEPMTSRSNFPGQTLKKGLICNLQRYFWILDQWLHNSTFCANLAIISINRIWHNTITWPQCIISDCYLHWNINAIITCFSLSVLYPPLSASLICKGTKHISNTLPWHASYCSKCLQLLVHTFRCNCINECMT